MSHGTVVQRAVAALAVLVGCGGSWASGLGQELARPWTVAATPYFSVGRDSNDPRYQIGGVGAARRTSGGGVVVANNMVGQVFEYSESGQFLRAIGRKGDGPGEYRGIGSIAVVGDSLYVFDNYWQRIGVLDTARELARENRLFPAGDLRFASLDRLQDGGWVGRESDFAAAPLPGSMARDTVAFYYLDTDFALGPLLARVPAQITAAVAIEGRSGYRPALFTPRPVHHVFGNCLYVSQADEPLVDVISPSGAKVASLRLDAPEGEATARLLDQTVEWFVDAVPAEGQAHIRRFLRELPRPERTPLFSGLVVDALGYLWLQTWTAPMGPGREWQVFDARGARVASLSFASDFVIHEVGVDYVLGVGKGELDEEMVEAYTLRRPAAAESQVHQACAAP